MDLTIVPGVPIARTGHFELESGPVDFAIEHLTAAAEAFASDPAVVAPRIRIEGYGQGHLDGDAMAAEASGQGGPSVGWCDNLQVQGNSLVADLHVPTELAAAMEAFYPGRSIEGLFGWTTATGHTHDFIATGLLLLGTSWPGVTTLPDFQEIQAEFAAAVADGEIIAAQAGYAVDAPTARVAVCARMPITARAPSQLAQAGLSVGDLRMRWYAAEAADELQGLPDTYDFWSFYVIEARVADDGQLYVVVLDENTGDQWRFDVTAISGTDVTFGEPTQGALDWQAAAAATAVRPALARYTTRPPSKQHPMAAASSSQSTTTQEDDSPMTDAQRRALATSLGLDPESATVEQIDEALEAAATAEPPEGTEDQEPVVEGEPAGVTARTVSVSREQWERTQADAAAGAQARADQIAAERTALVTAAMQDGRVTPAEAGLTRDDQGQWVPGWRRDLDDAPEVTARALERLERGKYPGVDNVMAVGGQSTSRDMFAAIMGRPGPRSEVKQDG